VEILACHPMPVATWEKPSRECERTGSGSGQSIADSALGLQRVCTSTWSATPRIFGLPVLEYLHVGDCLPQALDAESLERREADRPATGRAARTETLDEQERATSL
jgi:hypothetical protein